MARCEVCGCKITGGRRFCGETKCENAEKALPRCYLCGQLNKGNTGDDCPSEKSNGKHVWLSPAKAVV